MPHGGSTQPQQDSTRSEQASSSSSSSAFDPDHLPSQAATGLWEATVATLEKIGDPLSETPLHWRFMNHTTGETMAMRLVMSANDNSHVILREMGGRRQMRVDDSWLAISSDPEEQWDMRPHGLRVRWGANIWEGSFNKDKTVWSSTSGYVKREKNFLWKEVLGTGKTFTFVETKREAGIVYLFDSSRGLKVRLTPTVMQFHPKMTDENEWQVVKRGQFF